MSFVFSALPLSIVSGGNLRNYKVFPYLINELRGLGLNEILIYPPITDIKWAILSLSTSTSVEDAGKLIHEQFDSFIKSNNISTVTREIINEALPYVIDYVKKLNNMDKINRFLHNKILNLGYIYIMNQLLFDKYFIKKLLISYLHNNVVGIYGTEGLGSIFSTYKIATYFNASTFIMAQLPLLPDIYLLSGTSLLFSFAKTLSSYTLFSYIGNLLEELLRSKLLKLILSVSPAPLLSNRIIGLIRNYGLKIGVPYPANAVDPSIFRFRRVEGKDRIAVFFARLTPAKGIFELLRAWKIVENSVPGAKLRIMGLFTDDEVKVKFFRLMRELNLRNVEFLGFVKDRDELHRLVSEARVLIYPSHEDSFSLAALESLALGVAVVTYGIPAIRWTYKDLPNVFMVKEGDYIALAKKAIEILNMSERDYVGFHENETVSKFLKLHSSWENVAKAEFRLVRPFVIEALSRVKR